MEALNIEKINEQSSSDIENGCDSAYIVQKLQVLQLNEQDELLIIQSLQPFHIEYLIKENIGKKD